MLAALHPKTSVHEKGELRPRISVALTFLVSSPGPLGLRKWFLSAPGALGSSLSFTGKSSFLSLWATTRDTDSSSVTVPDQGMSLTSSPVLPGQHALSCSSTAMGKHKNLQACGSLSRGSWFTPGPYWKVPPHLALQYQLPILVTHCLQSPRQKRLGSIQN